MEKEFEKFLKKYAKKDFNFKSYLQDLADQHDRTGLNEYELSKFDSNDGKTHLFSYEKEDLAK